MPTRAAEPMRYPSAKMRRRKLPLTPDDAALATLQRLVADLETAVDCGLGKDISTVLGEIAAAAGHAIQDRVDRRAPASYPNRGAGFVSVDPPSTAPVGVHEKLTCHGRLAEGYIVAGDRAELARMMADWSGKWPEPVYSGHLGEPHRDPETGRWYCTTFRATHCE